MTTGEVEHEPARLPDDQGARGDVDDPEPQVGDGAVHVVQVRRAARDEAEIQGSRAQVSHPPSEAGNPTSVPVRVRHEVDAEAEVLRVGTVYQYRSEVKRISVRFQHSDSHYWQYVN